jgi:hypothetical protein
MKQLSRIGAEILSSIEFPFPVVPIVQTSSRELGWKRLSRRPARRAHSHRARILAVVDCFDALTLDRPYRGAHSRLIRR